MSTMSTNHYPKTPPRPHGRPLYMTPQSKQHQQSSNHRSSSRKRTFPRMSPTPKRLHYGSIIANSVENSPYYSSSRNAAMGGDRFIPSRRQVNIEVCRRALLSENDENKDQSRDTQLQPTSASRIQQHYHEERRKKALQKEFERRLLSSLCKIPLDKLNENAEPTNILSFGSGLRAQHSNIQNPAQAAFPNAEKPYSHDTLHSGLSDHAWIPESASVGSIKRKYYRKVDERPFNCINTSHHIIQDIYLNLISWSDNGILAVAVDDGVYIWNSMSNNIACLVTLKGPVDYVTSLSWCTLPGQRSSYLAVGTKKNLIGIFDVQKMRRVRWLSGHTGRVTCLDWSTDKLTSGSRDSSILIHDIRCQNPAQKFEGHQQEVCSLKWNVDSLTLASGGDDNSVCIWDASKSARRYGGGCGGAFSRVSPRCKFTHHRAAVLALDWCPFSPKVLASGGGESDETIKIWNVDSSRLINSVDTGSPVTSLIWSKYDKELCSAHGCFENQIKLWKFPEMEMFKEVHTHNDLLLSMISCYSGNRVVTMGADEKIRFWEVFRTPKATPTLSPLSFGKLSSFNVPIIR